MQVLYDLRFGRSALVFGNGKRAICGNSRWRAAGGYEQAADWLARNAGLEE